MAQPRLDDAVDALRRFNRFYTSRIGVLEEHLLESDFTLAEARVLYELGSREDVNASMLVRELRLDPGYLSRILRAFERRGLLTRTRSEVDGRKSRLALTPAGRAAFRSIDGRSRREIGAMLERLTAEEQNRVVGAASTIAALLGGEAAEPDYALRPHQPGDMGWIIHRHAVLYAEEYGWNAEFEALVAEIAAKFIRDFDGARERCWIAERNGEILGSVCLVKGSESTAKLRLLLVEPGARGLGLGKRLVAETIGFARAAGYRKIALWTNDVLHAARHIYEKAGFRLVAAEKHYSFGHDLVGETWELVL
jgi:DNA-binding MarR family transcriptional regulator/N-acetylglutamate synthase-like GNAT family acetyltransferase